MNSALIQITETPANIKLLTRMITIEQETVVIGNSIESDLILIDDNVEDSQQYISITPVLGDNSFIFKALTNKVMINDSEVLELAPITLNDGDIVSINGYYMLFSWDNTASEPRAETVEKIAINESTYQQTDTLPKGSHGFDVNNILSGIEQPESIIDVAEPLLESSAFDYQPEDVVGFDNNEQSKQLNNIEEKLDSLIDTCNNPWLQQKELLQVIEKVVETFVKEFSPQYIEEIIGKPGIITGRHWKVYQKYFAQKQETGQFSRQFKALLIECLQEK